MTPDQPLPFPGVTIDNLPPASRYPGRRQWVTDLREGLGGYVRSNGKVWETGLSDAVSRRAVEAIALHPLKHRPVQIFTGMLGLGVNAPISFVTAAAWNGCRFTIVRQATGLGNLTILGKTLSLGGWADVVFDGTAWVSIRGQGIV